jgi:hypothetical protein
LACFWCWRWRRHFPPKRRLALNQSCTRFLHACNALCNVQTGLTNLHPPPYRSRQIIYLSHSESVPLPLRNSSGQSLISYMPGRAVASLCSS